MTHTTDDQKQFAALRAQLAMQDHTLHRTSPDDGRVVYYAERWGLMRYVPTLSDVERILIHIGGAS